jgi:hypothetical protein
MSPLAGPARLVHAGRASSTLTTLGEATDRKSSRLAEQRGELAEVASGW